MEKRAILDVDSTLWGFDEILYKELYSLFPKIETPDKWNEWEFYQKYGISKNNFYKVVDKIHKQQEYYKPFKDASLFSYILRKDYHVTIASHRKPKYKEILKKWLDSNEITYDDIFVDNCKFHLFDNVDLVVDDSPIFLIEARKRNAKMTCGLVYPWNKKLEKEFLLCEDLKELIIEIDKVSKFKFKRRF